MPSAAPTTWWVRIPVALALAFATLIAPGLSGAAQADTGTALITAYDSNLGFSLPGTQIDVFTVDPSTAPDATPVASATTGTDWIVLDLEEGQTWIRATRPGFLTQVRQVVFTSDIAYVEFAMSIDPAQAGTLTGRLIDEDGDPLRAGRGHVEFYDVENDGNSSSSTSHNDGDGVYSALLAPGDYRVKVSDDNEDYPSTWVGGTTWETARTFTVTKNGTVTLPTTTLRPGPRVKGTVTDAAGLPIRSARVELYSPEDSSEPLVSATTSKTGAYSLPRLDSGTYKLSFQDATGDYVGEWYADAADFDSAATITIERDDVTANAVLAERPIVVSPARLSGVVQDAAGQPVRGAYVDAYRKVVDGDRWFWTSVTWVRTDRTGRYSFESLEAGTYSVKVTSELENDFESQWYRGKYNERSADSIDVPAEGSVTAQPMTISRYGTISGRVSEPNSPDAYDSNLYVEVFDADGDYVDDVRTSPKGNYTTAPLPPGTYSVRSHGRQYVANETNEFSFDLVAQWWRNAYSPASSTKVTVTADGDTSGIDFSLGNSLTNLAKPTVSGSGAYGTRLTASPGTWNRSVNTVFGYQWTRNGAPIAGATNTTYTTTTADLGRSVAVKVTATDKYELLTAGTATSAAKVVKGKATVGVKASGAKRSASITIGLALQGLSPAKQTGTVRVYDGRKLKKTVTVRQGNAAVRLTGLKKGKHTLTVKFAGTGSHLAASASAKVKVR